MTLEVAAPIIGVIALLTLMLLLMRHASNKIYPEPDTDGENADIELGSVGKSPSVKSERTLVDGVMRERNTLDHVNAKTPLWRRAVGKGVEWRRDSGIGKEDGQPFAKSGGVGMGVGMGVGGEAHTPMQEQVAGAVHSPRQSSSVYSRSVDGFTVYPERVFGR